MAMLIAEIDCVSLVVCRSPRLTGLALMAMSIAEIDCVSLMICRSLRLAVLAWMVGSQQWIFASQPGLLEGWYISDVFIPLFPKPIQCHWRVKGRCKGGVEECCRQCMGRL